MTHMRWEHGQKVRESTDSTLCGPLCRWRASLAHRYVLKTRTRAELNGRPRLRPCESEQARRQHWTRQDFHLAPRGLQIQIPSLGSNSFLQLQCAAHQYCFGKDVFVTLQNENIFQPLWKVNCVDNETFWKQHPNM